MNEWKSAKNTYNLQKEHKIKPEKSVMNHQYQLIICLFKRDITALYSQTPSVSSLALSAFINCTKVVWSWHCTSAHAASQHSLERERCIPTDVKRKRDTKSRWKSEKPVCDCTITHSIFTSLCTVDFGYHCGCGDGWWCWLFLRRSTAMLVQSCL